MFRYRRAKAFSCKACVVNHTNSCATNITIAQPRNAPPKPNREKAIKVQDENGNDVPTFVPNQNTVQDSYFYLDMGNRKAFNLKNSIYKNKIIHLIHDKPFSIKNNAWQNQAEQREHIFNALKLAEDDDYIMFSDPDEIPSPNTLRKLNLRKK